jgi:hypothetical protein
VIALRGFLGISHDVPVAYQKIGVYFNIDADVSEDQKEELVKMEQKYRIPLETDSRRASKG